MTFDDINFLPAGYSAKRVHRQANRWRGLVVVAFAGLIVTGLAGNRLQHARLTAEYLALQPQANAVRAAEQQLNEINATLDELAGRADLRARLQLRPATTRLYTAVTQSLSSDSALEELKIATARGTTATPVDPAAPPTTPERQDLEAWMQTEGPMEIELRGVAPDVTAVSRYIESLAATKLFDQVHLGSTDHHDYQGHNFRVFSARLVVRSVAKEMKAPQ